MCVIVGVAILFSHVIKDSIVAVSMGKGSDPWRREGVWDGTWLIAVTLAMDDGKCAIIVVTLVLKDGKCRRLFMLPCAHVCVPYSNTTNAIMLNVIMLIVIVLDVIFWNVIMLGIWCK
jgi:hypothetical protein